MLGDAAAVLKPRVDSEIANNLSYMEASLGTKDFFVGSDLTGADIQLIFVVEAAGARLAPIPAGEVSRTHAGASRLQAWYRKGWRVRVDEPLDDRKVDRR